MVLLEKLWDDVVAGPQPDRGLGKLRKLTTQNLTNKDDGGKYQRSMSMPSSAAAGGSSSGPVTPTTPGTPTTPNSARRDNVWRSVFHPGSNLNTRSIGNQIFDKPTHASSPTVYDWLYSDDTRSKHQ